MPEQPDTSESLEDVIKEVTPGDEYELYLSGMGVDRKKFVITIKSDTHISINDHYVGLGRAAVIMISALCARQEGASLTKAAFIQRFKEMGLIKDKTEHETDLIFKYLLRSTNDILERETRLTITFKSRTQGGILRALPPNPNKFSD